MSAWWKSSSKIPRPSIPSTSKFRSTFARPLISICWPRAESGGIRSFPQRRCRPLSGLATNQELRDLTSRDRLLVRHHRWVRPLNLIMRASYFRASRPIGAPSPPNPAPLDAGTRREQRRSGQRIRGEARVHCDSIDLLLRRYCEQFVVANVGAERRQFGLTGDLAQRVTGTDGVFQRM